MIIKTNAVTMYTMLAATCCSHANLNVGVSPTQVLVNFISDSYREF